MGLAQTGKLLPLLIPATVIALTVLGMVIAAIFGRRRESLRRAALASVAAELGMAFTPEDEALLTQFGGYAVFPTGAAPRATSVMRGTIEGSPVLLFDDNVAVGIGKGRHTLRQTVAGFDVADKPLPVFAAQGWQQNWLTKLLDTPGDKVIDFPDDPEFTRRFRVVGDDAEAVRRLFGPDARSFLTPRTQWMFRSDGRWLLMCRIGKRPKPGEYRAFVKEVVDGMRVMTRAGVKERATTSAPVPGGARNRGTDGPRSVV
jgi:hypothetical protein